MTDYTFFRDLASEAESPRRGIHSQTLVRNERFELVLFAMAAGEQLSEHTAARPAIVHVLNGKGELVVAGDTFDLDEDAWLFMPPRTAHAITATTPLAFALYLLPQDPGA
jgi:quercetin dioxygenase-like cupin family protein